MRYVSLFSGIEAASVAWGALGWEAVAFSEIDPFCCAVLSARYPDVPNLGDVTLADWSDLHGKADVVIGGSPCQSFSVAGLRKGLADPRGNLMLEFLRACERISPRWIVWENVPGVLSSSGGSDFQALLEAVAHLWPGGGAAWRVLDAQFYGVAQRRRRVFLVVCTTDPWGGPAVLLEREGLRGNHPTSREKRQELARAAGCGARSAGFCAGAAPSAGSIGYALEQSPTLRANAGSNQTPAVCFQQNQRDEVRLVGGDGSHAGTIAASAGTKNSNLLCGPPVALAGNTIGRAPGNGGNGTGYEDDGACYTLTATDVHGVAYALDAGSPDPRASEGLFHTLKRGGEGGTHDAVACVCSSNGGDVAGTLCARDCKGVGSQSVSEGKVVGMGGAERCLVRRLTPVECERLQGFPDNWTRIPWRGKAEEQCPDGPRYKACGNSMAVPVIRWLGERIELVDGLIEARKRQL